MRVAGPANTGHRCCRYRDLQSRVDRTYRAAATAAAAAATAANR